MLLRISEQRAFSLSFNLITEIGYCEAVTVKTEDSKRLLLLQSVLLYNFPAKENEKLTPRTFSEWFSLCFGKNCRVFSRKVSSVKFVYKLIKKIDTFFSDGDFNNCNCLFS
uniref:Uncharacterized protein n=1 Tax=Cacopsylla melanoneura TaxID=428564 RepID=A0A8D8VLH2_9HEMI